MKKRTNFMFAGILALLLCLPSGLMAQSNSQRESKLRNVLSGRRGGLVLGSTLIVHCCRLWAHHCKSPSAHPY